MNRIAMTMLLFIVLLISTVNTATAAIYICFNSNGTWTCFLTEGSCDGWCPDPPGTPICAPAAGMAIRPDAFISVVNGQAWLVNGNEVTQIASDAKMAFIRKIQTKYPLARRNSPRIQKKIVKEFACFYKKADDGKVSVARQEALSKELGLKIYRFDSVPK